MLTEPRTPEAQVRRLVAEARFPLSMRGYDPLLVDALLDHLAEVLAPPAGSGAGSPIDRRTEGAPMPTHVVLDPSRVAAHEFRRVRRGYDPVEVRHYLDELASALAETAPVGDAARAAAVLAEARAEAEQLLRDAHREVDACQREQAAMSAWFGAGPGGGGLDGAPGGAIAGGPAGSPIEGFGSHVERIVATAEAEARALVTEAETVLAAARAEAEAVRAAAVPLAVAEVDDVLRAARGELEVVHRDLAAGRARLAELHEALGEALARPVAPTDLAAPESFVGVPEVIVGGLDEAPQADQPPSVELDLNPW